MLAIKFKRIGKKKQASFRIVVMEKRSKLQGRAVEDLGWFNPRSKDFKIEKERTLYWIKMGAQATPSVHNLLLKKGITRGKKIPLHKKAKEGKASGE